MVRRLLYPPEPQVDFVKVRTPAQRKAREKTKADATVKLKRAMAAALQLVADLRDGTVDYDKVGTSTVLGFFCMVHTLVYGVEPAELKQTQTYMGAISGITRLLQQEFNGEIEQVFEFVRWTWQREKRQFQTREGDFRIGWRYQFCSRALLTDYRIALAKSVNVHAAKAK